MRNKTETGHRLNEIIKTSFALEYEDAKEAGLLGYMARCLVQATMPHSDPKTSYFERTNGLVTLSIMGKPQVGIPYGSVPRTLLAWICTEAVKTKNPVLNLGRSQSEFLQKLGMHTDGRYTRALRNQAYRLFSSLISLTGEDKDSALGIENVIIARRALLFWNPKHPDERSLWESELVLNTDFFNEVTNSPVPVRLDYLNALRKSPMAMDIYTWLVYRVFLLRAKNRPFVQIPWVSLMAQFGSNYGAATKSDNLTEEQRQKSEQAAIRAFKFKFKKRLREVGIFYPEAVDKIEDEGDRIRIRSTALHVKRAPNNGAKIGPIPEHQPKLILP